MIDPATWQLVGWSALNLALLTVAGALAASVPGWWAVPVVAIAGAANGLVRRQTVHEAVLPRPMRWSERLGGWSPDGSCGGSWDWRTW